MDIYELIEKHKWSKEKPSRNHKITTVEFFKLCVDLRESSKVAEHLGLNNGTVSRWVNSYKELPKMRAIPINKITGYFGRKQCKGCEQLLPFECYTKSETGSFGTVAKCKECRDELLVEWRDEWQRQNPDKMRAQNAKYRAAKLQRTPTWANQEKIQEMYTNCPEGYHVDHILPLQGELVSGLHVENNLQYLPASKNISKGNKFQVG